MCCWIRKNSQEQEALGRSKGGFTTKIHAVVDALGNPLKFVLTPGQRHDIRQAELLTVNVEKAVVIADKGYDSQSIVDVLKSKECTVVIPSRKNRKIPRYYDQYSLKRIK